MKPQLTLAGGAGFWFKRYFARILHVLSDLWICSYPLLGVLCLIALIFWSPQGPEITSDLNEIFSTVTPSGADRVLAFAATIAAVLFCAAAVFFAAVSALGNTRHLQSTVPYWLTLLCLLSSAGMIFGAQLALGLIGLTIVVFLFMPAFDPIQGSFHIAAGKHGHRAALLLLLLGACIAAAAILSPVSFPRTVTTWPIVYSAFGFWILFWTLLAISLPRSLGWPSFWLAPVLLVVVVSAFNDDHALRMLDGRSKRPAAVQVLSVGYVQSWLRDHCPTKGTCTVRFVAAHGGGQRAAYWTQAVLRALNASDSDFDRSVFAFSGVSGGSLGGLSYYLARASDHPDWQDALEKVSSSDNLAPIISALLYRETVQAFIPHPIPALDRARIYEEGIEQSWRSEFGGGRPAPTMSDGFPQKVAAEPSLFLNSTTIEGGQRFVNSSLLPDSRFRVDALYAADPAAPFVAGPIANSTAAHLSSRFAWVNPHATISYRNGKAWGRLVDGGYNEGTGIVTLLEIVDAFRDALVSCGSACPPVNMEVTYIANDPRADDHLDGTPAAGPTTPPDVKVESAPNASSTPNPVKPFLWELLTPVTGYLHSEGNASSTALRYRIDEHRKGTSDSTHPALTFRVIALRRMIEQYTSGALGKPPDEWCKNYATWKPALGWWLSVHSRAQMTILLAAKGADGKASLLDFTKPGAKAPSLHDGCSKRKSRSG